MAGSADTGSRPTRALRRALLGPAVISLVGAGVGLAAARGGDSATAKSSSMFELLEENAATGRATGGEAVRRAEHPDAGAGSRAQVVEAADAMRACLQRVLGPQAIIEVTLNEISITGGPSPAPIPTPNPADGTKAVSQTSSVEAAVPQTSLDLPLLATGMLANSDAAKKSCDDQTGYTNALIDWESSPARRAERKVAATQFIECLGGEKLAKAAIERIADGSSRYSSEFSACMDQFGHAALELERPVI